MAPGGGGFVAATFGRSDRDKHKVICARAIDMLSMIFGCTKFWENPLRLCDHHRAQRWRKENDSLHQYNIRYIKFIKDINII